MGWKTIYGRRYFYEICEVEGDWVTISWGSGPEASEAAERVEREHEENALDLAVVKAWSERDRMLAALEQKIAMLKVEYDAASIDFDFAFDEEALRLEEKAEERISFIPASADLLLYCS